MKIGKNVREWGKGDWTRVVRRRSNDRTSERQSDDDSYRHENKSNNNSELLTSKIQLTFKLVSLSPFHLTRSKGVSSWPPESRTCRANDWQAFTNSNNEKITTAAFTLSGKSEAARAIKVEHDRISRLPSIIVAVETMPMVGSCIAL